ncbi:MAG: tRNA 2-thiouridine(34) synthase MnmA [Clostridia bacterium]|nr:tRNA 2-thiouridine(34) synthase MnmA [Clostridia bacterium]
MEKVLVGMSGGVDSSSCAAVLKAQGFEVGGITLMLCGIGDEQNIKDAKSVCDTLNIPHYTANLEKEFTRFVKDYFVNEYINGNTPNPCLECNRHIKFGAMLDKAIELGYDKIATGHYAKIKKRDDGRFLLYRADDLSKDQSYVLYSLTQKQLAHTLFPLGDKTKAESREIAAKNNLICADRPDSQDICFVPDGDYAAFIENHSNFKSVQGNYLSIDGKVLGKHQGVIHYTLGQRKGLGIALGKPQFVIDKNAETNEVVLGDEEHLFKTEIIVRDVNFIPFDKLENPITAKVKLRYRHEPSEATIYPLENNCVKMIFEKPQRAASPGQAAVFYDGDMCLGGGIIV